MYSERQCDCITQSAAVNGQHATYNSDDIMVHGRSTADARLEPNWARLEPNWCTTEVQLVHGWSPTGARLEPLVHDWSPTGARLEPNLVHDWSTAGAAEEAVRVSAAVLSLPQSTAVIMTSLVLSPDTRTHELLASVDVEIPFECSHSHTVILIYIFQLIVGRLLYKRTMHAKSHSISKYANYVQN